ncbi:torsin-1A [Misgurnus anguillicaudatus]|uniref:torsin-1A n=1 Tax=Misgurnus anguillicaudatus TaxID=75329 RepID=UPI003CCF034D
MCRGLVFVVASIFVAIIGIGYTYFYSFENGDNLLSFDSERLKKDLNKNLYGQHIVSEVVLKSVSKFMTDPNPNKPLVLSFHGTTGVGKNHVAKIIARNIYEKGEQSKHFITFISEHHFPHKSKVDIYSEKLKNWIRGNVSSFSRTMFVFDEMDKMNPRLIETIKPFLDYTLHVDGVSYRNASFIFLRIGEPCSNRINILYKTDQQSMISSLYICSNAGGDVINKITLDWWREGQNRENLQMNSKGMETQIFQNIFNDESSGFWRSHLIDHHLIDHFIPFLPLEMRHVRQCVLAEMANLNMAVDCYPELADTVARDIPYFPSKEKIYSVKGCKSVRQKLMLYTDL